MASTPISPEYAEGMILRLTLQEKEPVTSIEAKIIKCYKPFTLSCAMLVEMLEAPPDIPHKAVLKLYDRRFSHDYRDQERLRPWSPELEAELDTFMQSSTGSEFLRACEKDDDFVPIEGWSVAEYEARMHYRCSLKCAIETGAYHQMKPLQGKQIPSLFSAVSLVLRPAEEQRKFSLTDENVGDPWMIHGVLLEHIPGPTLTQMPECIAREAWQSIIDSGLETLTGDCYAACGVLNKDVRPDNFIVSPSASGDYRVVMIDFGNCELRDDDETDAEWGRDKWTTDEEGALGQIMRLRLRKIGFELEHIPKHRYLPFAPGEEEGFEEMKLVPRGRDAVKGSRPRQESQKDHEALANSFDGNGLTGQVQEMSLDDEHEE